MEHPVFNQTEAVLTQDDPLWGLTLRSELNAHPFFGGGVWDVVTYATTDAATCEVTLLSVTADPDEIMLLPGE